jgi:anti-sigma B factor antagonist
VEISRDGSGIPVIKLLGEVDLANADSLEAMIEPVLRTRPAHLIIDVSDLDFMDSSGIALLLRCARSAGSVRLRHPSPIIRRTVESMGLADILHLEP